MTPYPAYKASGIEWLGEIPVGWKMVRLKHLLLDGKDGIKIGPFGSSLKSDIIKEEGFKVYGQENVIKDDFMAGHRYIDDDKFLELNAYELFPGDIVITMMGTMGKSKVVPQNIEKGIMDSHLIRIRVNPAYFSPELISLLINDSNYIFTQTKLQSRGSIMEGLNSSIIKSLLFLVPPPDEQKQILAFIHYKTYLLDTYITKKQQQIERWQAYRTALINQAVTKGLNPAAPMKDSGIEWLGEIPAHWEIVKLKFLTTKVGSGVTPRGGSTVYQDAGIPLLRSQNIHFDGLRLDEVAYISREIHDSMSNTKVQPNDVLLNITGASIGRCYYVDENLGEANVNQHVCILRPNDEVKTKFLFNTLASNIGQDQVFYSQNGTSREGLNFEQLKNFIIPLPPQKEQIEVIQFLETINQKIFTLIAITQRQIERLQAYRTSLISDAVTGKIDVRNYTDYT